MKILKFCGTLLDSEEDIKKTSSIVLKEKEKPLIVISAFSGVTDSLLEAATHASIGDNKYSEVISSVKQKHLNIVSYLNSHQTEQSIGLKLKKLDEVLHSIFLLKELTTKMKDIVLSFGEFLSSEIVAAFYSNEGIESIHLDARDLIKTDDSFGEANVLFEDTYRNILSFFKHAKSNIVYVVPGFVGSTTQNQTTTLGRGSSDYTASIFGAALKAKSVEIWNNVDQFMTADPEIVPDAFSIPQLSYQEAIEMSNFGAKALYPLSILPSMRRGIPIVIKNIHNTSLVGTEICQYPKKHSRIVQGILSISKSGLIRIQATGIISISQLVKRVFSVLERSKIRSALTSQASSESSICFAVLEKDLDKTVRLLKEEFQLEIKLDKVDDISYQKNVAVVAIVGDNMQKAIGVSGKFFKALGQNGINIAAIAQGSSERNISVVINEEDKLKAINATHQAFFLSDVKTVNLFLAGVGLIGKTLLKQISEQIDTLKIKHSLRFRLIGLSRSNKSFLSPEGIDFAQAISKLNELGSESTFSMFYSKMCKLNLENSIFIDCTASSEVASWYEKVIKSSISIVTPNKHACSGSISYYRSLKSQELSQSVRFLYETNVGAGLPIIRTLNDLISSGDKILKIEAVLSGSLSFIFNSFKGDAKFSEVVKLAKEKGFTEPDPREDLSGMDVARKILILARESGSSIELEDVSVESFLPEACQKADTVETFFENLKEFDPVFEKRKKELEDTGEKLRYIATYENNKAIVKLCNVPKNHPFSALSGSDNIIAFTTNRYKENPLVVRGPGAGAEVTAAGVFADIMLISNYLL